MVASLLYTLIKIFHSHYYIFLQLCTTNLVVYADDVMIWTNNAKELEDNLNRLNNVGNKFTLKMNVEKTVVQKTNRNPGVS